MNKNVCKFCNSKNTIIEDQLVNDNTSNNILSIIKCLDCKKESYYIESSYVEVANIQK